MKHEQERQTSGTPLAKFMGRVVRVTDAVVGSLILIAIILNFSNVVSRYLFASAISWAEEALIFLSIWAVFLGAASSSWEGAHLRMDLMVAMLPFRWGKALDFLAALVSIVVGVIVVHASWQVVSMMARFGQRSTSTDIPMMVPHSAITVGFALIVVATAVRLWAHWQTKKPTAPHRDMH